MSDPETKPSVMVKPYSVSELADLREAVDRRFNFGSYLPMKELFDIAGDTRISGRSYNPGEQIATIEEQTRTHMVAGHTAEMLMAEERRSRDKCAV